MIALNETRLKVMYFIMISGLNAFVILFQFIEFLSLEHILSEMFILKVRLGKFILHILLLVLVEISKC